MGLEYVLNVPKSFWLNLQANYDSELLELNEGQTIAEEESPKHSAASNRTICFLMVLTHSKGIFLCILL